MTDAGITAFGAYLPRLRLQRKAMASANAWFNPSIMGQGKGERTMANWDEDAVTMAVEAARDALPGGDPFAGRRHIEALYFASTTMPFADRQNAGIIAEALNIGEYLQALLEESIRAFQAAESAPANYAPVAKKVKAKAS